LPADYQQMARQVIAHAKELYRHPGPLADAAQHAQILLESAWDALTDYAERKQDKGIVDYTDMIDLARQLLDIPEVLDHVASRFDCLVIDEFQDTNPLQFSLLWTLHEQGVPALIVGDVKQSIMGFQSADPRLMSSLVSKHRDQGQPLNRNWRSQASLMEIINAISAGMFGADYTRLTPKADIPSQMSPLEAVCFEGKGIKPGVQAEHIAARVKTILEDEKPSVYDARLKLNRSVRGGDIAILGFTHSRLKTYAEALTAIGVRSQLEQDGWFHSRPVQLLYHGLSYVADPGDTHAALYLAVTELGNDDLNTSTIKLVNGRPLCFPLLDRLAAVAENQEDLTVDALVAQTIDAMELVDVTSTWPEAGQARANLLRFQAEADAFVHTDREALAGGGFYGSGLKTFLAWLLRNLEEKNGDRQPTAHVHDEDAVRLITWHAAKGMEWPIVVVTTLDRSVEGRLPSLDIDYKGFDDLSAVLDNARIQYSPNFSADETNGQFKGPLDEKAKLEGLNLLYVALTRAKEQLILEWPQNLANSSKYTFWHLLCDAAKMSLDANQMKVGANSFPCRVTAADKALPEAFERPASPLSATLPVLGRRALEATALPDNLTPTFLTPSSLHDPDADPEPMAITTNRYGPPIELSLISGAERGLVVHRAIELIGQDVSADQACKALGIENDDPDWQVLESATRLFLRALSTEFQPVARHWEVPIVARNQVGSVIAGTVDLLVETDAGFWIVDHKSDETDDRDSRFARYWPQLDCYARALSDGMGLSVAGVAIHWVCYGEISRLEVKYGC
jgi:ATP-dependent exoDNAse (exonuclease V) beta subunit